MNAKEKQKLRHKNNNSHALCGIAIFVENYSAVEKEKPFFLELHASHKKEPLSSSPIIFLTFTFFLFKKFIFSPFWSVEMHFNELQKLFPSSKKNFNKSFLFIQIFGRNKLCAIFIHH